MRCSKHLQTVKSDPVRAAGGLAEEGDQRWRRLKTEGLEKRLTHVCSLGALKVRARPARL